VCGNLRVIEVLVCITKGHTQLSASHPHPHQHRWQRIGKPMTDITAKEFTNVYNRSERTVHF
jgi:hypothetical protein